MNFYFKDRKTFSTIAVCEGISWKLVLSTRTDVSELTCKNDNNVHADDFVFNQDGWLAIVKTVEREGSVMTIRAEKIERLFDRDICFTFGTKWPAEQTLRYYMLNDFEQGEDTAYNIPYLSSERTTLEAKPCKPVADQGVINLMSYIARARRLSNVFCKFTIADTQLKVEIFHEVRPTKTLITTNIPVEVTEEAFGGEIVSKVSTYTMFEGQEFLLESDLTHWYLLEDGSVTRDLSTATSPRKEGKWVLLKIESEDDPEQMARNTFAENSYTHKVTVRVPDVYAIYDFYDPVRVEVNNHVYQSYVSKKVVTSEGYVEYTFGDLKTSLMDKINEID